MIADEPLSRGSTFLHRADASAKLLVALAFSLATALTPLHPSGLLAPALALGLGGALLLASRPAPRHLLPRYLAVNVFLAFLWLTLPLTVPPTAEAPGVYDLLGLPLSRAGLMTALVTTLRANAILAALTALLATSPVADLGRAMARLGVPPTFCALVLFSYRYLGLLAEEQTRLLRAARMRGFTPGTNTRTYRTLAHLAAMVFVRSMERAERVQQAMLLRGFSGTFPSLAASPPTPADRIFLALGLAVSFGLALLAWKDVLA